MRPYNPIARAALACTVPVNCWHRHARHNHVDNSIVFVTATATQTVVEWHTILEDHQPTVTDGASVGVTTDILQGFSHATSSDISADEDNSDATSTRTSAFISDNDPVVTDRPSVSASANLSSNVHITPERLIPNGKKAGLSGYVGIEKLNAFKELTPYISWYSDYTPGPPTIGDVLGVGMLWGASGSPCGNEVNKRLSAFKKIVELTSPDIMFGFYEPDCYCADSSEMSAPSGTLQWNELLAPLGRKGTVLGSPSMCKQKDEDWLQPFAQGGLDHDWHVTSVHINKPNLDGIKEDIEYYASTYGKPIWVSEFACVHDKDGWSPCTDQNEINNFISEAVNFFENNETVVAYGPSNGNGLGNAWPLTDAVGDLTESGQAYLNAVKKLL